MNIKTIHIDQIRPYWRNPRNNEKAVEAVKASIKKFGYNQPIVVDKENVIIVGHTRYKALRQLGFEDVEVLIKNIDENKAKEYRIADNKAGEKAEWDEDLLMYELREIEELDDMKVFFDNGEIDSLLDIANEEYDYEDEDSSPAYNEEQRRNELQEKARQEIADSYADDDEKDDQEFEERVSAKVESDMRDEIREEMRREQAKIQEENDKIKELESKEKARFSNGSEEKEDDYIEIQCPHCDEKYVLSKSELLRAQKLRMSV